MHSDFSVVFCMISRGIANFFAETWKKMQKQCFRWKLYFLQGFLHSFVIKNLITYHIVFSPKSIWLTKANITGKYTEKYETLQKSRKKINYMLFVSPGRGFKAFTKIKISHQKRCFLHLFCLSSTKCFKTHANHSNFNKQQTSIY